MRPAYAQRCQPWGGAAIECLQDERLEKPLALCLTCPEPAERSKRSTGPHPFNTSAERLTKPHLNRPALAKVDE